MSLEKGFVDRNVFDTHGPFAGFQINNAIHQKKGITVRQQFHDIKNFEGHAVTFP
jgi:hypothetical protein